MPPRADNRGSTDLTDNVHAHRARAGQVVNLALRPLRPGRSSPPTVLLIAATEHCAYIYVTVIVHPAGVGRPASSSSFGQMWLFLCSGLSIRIVIISFCFYDTRNMHAICHRN